METLYEFITSTGGTITSIVVSVLIVIIIFSWIDRHPSKKPEQPVAKEPRRDDE